MKKSDPPIIVEQNFDRPIQVVWNAITERDQMIQWFFDNIPEFKPEVGFETEFVIQVEDRVYPHLWRLIEVEAPHKITYHWSYRNYPGEGLVTFELFEESEGTKLRLTNIVLEDFPQDIPEFKREAGIAGWNYFIQQSLKGYLG